jgi:hypothetical protein
VVVLTPPLCPHSSVNTTCLPPRGTLRSSFVHSHCYCEDTRWGVGKEGGELLVGYYPVDSGHSPSPYRTLGKLPVHSGYVLGIETR